MGVNFAGRWRLGCLVWIGVLLATPLFLFGQSGADVGTAQSSQASEGKPWWRGITTDGYLSLSYSYNANHPESRLNQFRVFDFNDNEPQLDVAQLVVQRPVSGPREFGFRIDMIAGPGAPEVTASYGLFRDTHTGVAHHFDIPEA